MVEILNLMLSPREIFLVVFLVGLGAFLYLDRNKIERHYILFYRRTKRGIELIDDIARKAPRFWKYYGWTGVVTGFLSVVAGTALFAYTIGDMITRRSVENGPSLLLPGLVSENQWNAGVSFVPIEYWVVGVGIIMVVHEMSHGIVARTEGFELNSVGWVVMGILPGAFVEPKGENMLPGDEANEDPDKGMWEQGNWKQRLKVLGAGSFANYITGALFILLFFGFQSAVTAPSGVFYVAQDGYAAAEANMTNGTLIQVNSQQIDTLKDLQQVSDNIGVNDTVELWTTEGNFTITATQGPEGYDGGYIGVRLGQNTVIKDTYLSAEIGDKTLFNFHLVDRKALLEWFASLLYTVGLLNILIGLFNMLPIKPLDGGLMVETVVKHYDESKLHYVDTLSVTGWFVILGSMLLSLLVPML